MSFCPYVYICPYVFLLRKGYKKIDCHPDNQSSVNLKI